MFQDQEFSLDHISCMGAAISESISVHNGDALKMMKVIFGGTSGIDNLYFQI